MNTEKFSNQDWEQLIFLSKNFSSKDFERILYEENVPLYVEDEIFPVRYVSNHSFRMLDIVSFDNGEDYFHNYIARVGKEYQTEIRRQGLVYGEALRSNLVRSMNSTLMFYLDLSSKMLDLARQIFENATQFESAKYARLFTKLFLVGEAAFLHQHFAEELGLAFEMDETLIDVGKMMVDHIIKIMMLGIALEDVVNPSLGKLLKLSLDYPTKQSLSWNKFSESNEKDDLWVSMSSEETQVGRQKTNNINESALIEFVSNLVLTKEIYEFKHRGKNVLNLNKLVRFVFNSNPTPELGDNDSEAVLLGDVSNGTLRSRIKEVLENLQCLGLLTRSIRIS